jgi:hypothetical protein
MDPQVVHREDQPDQTSTTMEGNTVNSLALPLGDVPVPKVSKKAAFQAYCRDANIDFNVKDTIAQLNGKIHDNLVAACQRFNLPVEPAEKNVQLMEKIRAHLQSAQSGAQQQPPDGAARAQTVTRQQQQQAQPVTEMYRIQCQALGLPDHGTASELLERLHRHAVSSEQAAAGSQEDRSRTPAEEEERPLQPKGVEFFLQALKELYSNEASYESYATVFRTLAELGLLENLCNTRHVLRVYQNSRTRLGKQRQDEGVVQMLKALDAVLPRLEDEHRLYLLEHHNFDNEPLRKANKGLSDAEKLRQFDEAVLGEYKAELAALRTDTRNMGTGPVEYVKDWEDEQYVPSATQMEVWRNEKDKVLDAFEFPTSSADINKHQYWTAWWIKRQKNQLRGDDRQLRHSNLQYPAPGIAGDKSMLITRRDGTMEIRVRNANKTNPNPTKLYDTVIVIEDEEAKEVIKAHVAGRRKLSQDYMFYDKTGKVIEKSAFSKGFGAFFGKERFPVEPNANGNKRWCATMARKTPMVEANRDLPRLRDLPHQEASNANHRLDTHLRPEYHNRTMVERGEERVAKRARVERSNDENDEMDHFVDGLLADNAGPSRG